MAGLDDLLRRHADPFGSVYDRIMKESLLPAKPQPIDPVTRARLGGDPWQGVQTRVGEDASMSPANMAIGLIGGPALRGIRAYHASPHRFDKFDINKVGTGQGAQSYGHGIYVAENPAVSGLGGEYWREFARRFTQGNSPEAHAVRILEGHGGNRAAAAAEVEAALASRVKGAYLREQLEAVRDLLKSNKPVGPSVYEVNIRANPEQFLDWDRPLSGQAPEVRATLERLGVPAETTNYYVGPGARSTTGEEAYRHLTPGFVSSAPGYREPQHSAASSALRDAGIPGIKYLDQGSRGSGTGTSNYVLFDDSIIDILKRYGLVGGAAVPPAFAGYTGDNGT